MRVLMLVPAALCLGAAPPAETAPEPVTMPSWSPYAAANACPETPMSLAREQGQRPGLRRLTELPDAQAFAAVDRRVGGCPAPMSLTEARSSR